MANKKKYDFANYEINKPYEFGRYTPRAMRTLYSAAWRFKNDNPSYEFYTKKISKKLYFIRVN